MGERRAVQGGGHCAPPPSVPHCGLGPVACQACHCAAWSTVHPEVFDSGGDICGHVPCRDLRQLHKDRAVAVRLHEEFWHQPEEMGCILDHSGDYHACFFLLKRVDRLREGIPRVMAKEWPRSASSGKLALVRLRQPILSHWYVSRR